MHSDATTAETRRSARASVLSVTRPATVSDLFWCFMLMSVVGLVVETLASYPVDGVWKDRAGLLWGPFSPIYGLGAVLFTVLLQPIAHRSAPLVFAVAAAAGAGFEYLVGSFWQKFFGIVAWSYVDEPFNLGGHTCLRMAVVWGLLGLAWIRLGWPLFLRLSDAVPRNRVRTAVTAAAAVFLVADVLMTFVAIDCWYGRQAGLPVETPVQRFCAEHFDDAFMAGRFQTMGMYVDQASLR